VGLEDERQAFLRLQLKEQADGVGDLLVALEPLLGVGSVAGDLVEWVGLLVAAGVEQAFARAPHRERLAANDHLHPGGEVPRMGGQGLCEQDLDCALVGVIGVIGTEGVAPSGAPQDGFRGGELRQRIAPRAGEGRGEVGSHLHVKPAPIPARPGTARARREGPCRLRPIGEMRRTRRYAQPRL
jgi:hypothetical protein